jgi:hypothetical protein
MVTRWPSLTAQSRSSDLRLEYYEGEPTGVAIGSPLSMLIGIVFLVALLYGCLLLLRMAFRSGRAEADREEHDRWRP